MKAHYIILIITGIFSSIQAKEPEMLSFREELTPIDILRSEIYSIPVHLELISKQSKKKAKTANNEVAQEYNIERLQLLYKIVITAEEDFIQYVIAKKPSLTNDEKRLLAILQRKKTEGGFETNFLDKASANEIIDALKSEYNELKPKTENNSSANAVENAIKNPESSLDNRANDSNPSQ